MRHTPTSSQPRLNIGKQLLALCLLRAEEEGMSVSEYIRTLIAIETGTANTAVTT
jgi:hypothetical protein